MMGRGGCRTGRWGESLSLNRCHISPSSSAPQPSPASPPIPPAPPASGLSPKRGPQPYSAEALRALPPPSSPAPGPRHPDQPSGPAAPSIRLWESQVPFSSFPKGPCTLPAQSFLSRRGRKFTTCQEHPACHAPPTEYPVSTLLCLHGHRGITVTKEKPGCRGKVGGGTDPSPGLRPSSASPDLETRAATSRMLAPLPLWPWAGDPAPHTLTHSRSSWLPSNRAPAQGSAGSFPHSLDLHSPGAGGGGGGGVLPGTTRVNRASGLGVSWDQRRAGTEADAAHPA